MNLQKFQVDFTTIKKAKAPGEFRCSFDWQYKMIFLVVCHTTQHFFGITVKISYDILLAMLCGLCVEQGASVPRFPMGPKVPSEYFSCWGLQIGVQLDRCLKVYLGYIQVLPQTQKSTRWSFFRFVTVTFDVVSLFRYQARTHRSLNYSNPLVIPGCRDLALVTFGKIMCHCVSWKWIDLL